MIEIKDNIDQPQKIALFTFSLSGGAGKMLRNLAWGFNERGFRVDLIYAKHDVALLEPLPKNIGTINFGSNKVLNTLPKLFRYLKRENPNILLSTVDTSNLIAVWANMLTMLEGKKRVLCLREANNLTATWEIQRSKLFRHCMRFMVRAFYKQADSIIAVSQGVADDLRSICGKEQKQIFFIDNPVISLDIKKKIDEEIFHPWIKNKDIPIILSAGRFVKKKKFDILLKAFSIVIEQYPCRLILLGGGEEKSNLEKLIANLELDEFVDMPGYTENPYWYMAKSDLFVLSSYAEGHPNVLVEAMHVGLPIVSTNCNSGPKQILCDGKYGSLVPINNPKAMAKEILINLKTKKGRIFTENLKKRAIDYSVSRIADEYIKIFFNDTK